MAETTETARALLYRHGLPEDIIDGALALHAQELAAVQRKALTQTDDPVFYEGEAGWLVNLIDPALAAVEPEPEPAPPYSPSVEARVEERRPDGSWRTWTIRDDPDRARREYDRQAGEQADRAWRLLRGVTTWTTVAEHKPEAS